MRHGNPATDPGSGFLFPGPDGFNELFLVVDDARSYFQVGHFIDGFIPGSVIGMVLLFLSLAFRWIKPHQVGSISTLLTQNMGLFFVPAGVGLMNAMGIISQYWVVLLTASLVSTLLVIASVALPQESFEKKRHHG